MKPKITQSENRIKRSESSKKLSPETNLRLRQYELLLHDLATEMKLFGKVSRWADLD
jgi:transposase